MEVTGFIASVIARDRLLFSNALVHKPNIYTKLGFVRLNLNVRPEEYGSSAGQNAGSLAQFPHLVSGQLGGRVDR